MATLIAWLSRTAVNATAGARTPLASIITAGLVLVTIVGGIVLSIAAAVQLGLVGLKIKQRQWWLFCYLTGWGECLMFPFGTILGIFTILVLGRPSVKKLFGVD